MWYKNQEVPEEKKIRCAKKDVLKMEHTLFIAKLVGNFALMILEQMR